MKKIKYIIFILLLFIAIGFATISVTLSIEGNADLAGDLDSFNVYYSNVYVNGNVDYSVLTSPTKLDFTTTLKDPGETYTITYDVTNGSKNFDADVTMTCTDGNELLSVVNDFDTSTSLTALETRSGTLTVKKLKSIISYDTINYSVSCTITAVPIEIDYIVEGASADKQYAVLAATTKTDTTMFRSADYKEKIKTITFEDTISAPEGALESWDIGVAQNGNVMAYLVANPEDATMYDLYIQSNGKVYANRDMSYWFAGFSNVETLNGLEHLDTSSATNMSYMFYSYGKKVTELSLDLTTFDTSNVTTMGGMFEEFGYKSDKITLDLSSFDTKKVTNMVYTFDDIGYYATNFILDVSSFDTSNVKNMNHMFNNAGRGSLNFELDVSGFDTSNVQNMNYMFNGAGYSNPDFELDVSGFDTSNVTNMGYMFNYAGFNSKTFILDVSGFDTSKVTNMKAMFSCTGYSNPNFVLDVSNFDTSNVTDMSYMFSKMSYFSTVLKLDVSNFDTSKVTDMRAMFQYVGYSNPNFELDVSGFDMSKVTDASYMFEFTGYISSKLNTSIIITNPNLSSYDDMFSSVAKEYGAQMRVDYTEETSDLVDSILLQVPEESNVIKGNLVE